MDGLDCLGCDDVGFIDTIFQTAGGLMQGIAGAVEQDEAQEAAQQKQTQQVTAAIQADADATLTAARATMSSQLHLKTAAADEKERAKKEAQQNAAGAGLDDNGIKQRVAAASKALADAKKNATAKPKDFYPPILVKAWVNTLSKIQGQGEDGSAKGSQESWLTRRVAGPLSGSTILVGAGILGILGFLVLKKKTAH